VGDQFTLHQSHNMRNILFISSLSMAVAATFLVGCGGEEKEPPTREHQDLQYAAEQKDKDIEQFIRSMLKIQNNLDSIKELEKIVTLNRPSGKEGAQSMDEKIMDDIKLLYLKMEQNKLIIAKMEKDLKNSSIYNAQLVKMVERLKKDLSAKEEEIVKLKDELAKLKIYIDELIADVDKLALEKEGLEETVVKKEEEIAAKDDEMHTAYWIVGTAKELKEKGVMTKEGGFIGIGRAKKLSGSVDLNKLTKINTKEVKNIAIGGKKAELISPHPAGTYEWKGDKKKDGLVITDHEGFWRNSKVLVIVVD